MRPHTALTIAGSDPSGGAGIQADLRTLQSLHIVGTSCITALTVQNSVRVREVHPTPPEILRAQLNAILEDTQPDAIKIGMLGGEEQVRVVASALRQFQCPHIVLDPVLASTGGVPLLDDAGRERLLNELMPLCTLITPNLGEAAILTGIDLHNPNFIERASERFFARHAKAVLIKGGHAEGDPVDWLCVPDKEPMAFSGKRLDTMHTHGTGCFFSSAIAAFLAHEYVLEEAVKYAKQAITDALQNSIVIGTGRGYPNLPFAWYSKHMQYSERLNTLRGVYVLTDPHLRPDRTPEAIVTAALAGGARVIQLRDKTRETRDLIELARQLGKLCHEQGAIFIVNDRVDVALAADADGVHLGPDDMHPADARAILGLDRLIGVSVSSVEEARPIAEYASYLGVGAIYGTKTKSDAGDAVGPERISTIKQAYPNLPIVAIGGITPDNLGEVIHAGADSIAVVSAVVCAADMTDATRALDSQYKHFVR